MDTSLHGGEAPGTPRSSSSPMYKTGREGESPPASDRSWTPGVPLEDCISDQESKEISDPIRIDLASWTSHRLAELSGPMDRRAFATLVDTIDASPTPPQIVVYQGQVLDGVHTLKACEAAGVTPVVVEYIGKSPEEFLIRRNLVRRHLRAGQRAVSIVSMCAWVGPGRPGKSADSVGFITDGKPRLSTKQMAAVAGVRQTYIQAAKRIYKNGLCDKVLSGEITFEEADARISQQMMRTKYYRRGRDGARSKQYRPTLDLGVDDLETYDDPETYLEEVLENMAHEIATRDARIQELEAENEDLKARLQQTSRQRGPRRKPVAPPTQSLRLPI